MSNNKSKVKNLAPHDQLIKKAFEHPANARELLEEYLPEKIRERLDLSTICVEKESHIDDKLKRKFSDIICSVKTKNNLDAFVYCMLEHQSSSDYWIAFRLWQYSLLLLQRHQKKKQKLPVIIPLVLYNGKKTYDAPLSFWELFEDPDLARVTMGGNYKLIDLHGISNDEINYQKQLSIVLFAMKNIHNQNMLEMLEEQMKRCHKAILIDKKQNYLNLKLSLCYTDSKVPYEEKDEAEGIIRNNLPENDEEGFMRTVADYYMEQGFAKGEARGIAKGEARGIAKGEALGMKKNAILVAQKMLKKGLKISDIMGITDLTLEQIKKIKSSPL